MKLLLIIAAILAMATGAGISYYNWHLYNQAALYSEAYSLSVQAKIRVTDYYARNKSLPHDNQQALLPPAHTLYGTGVKRVSVIRDGVLVVEFSENLANSTMVFTPKVDIVRGGLRWRCSSDSIAPRLLDKLRPKCAYTPETREGVLMQAIATGDLDAVERQLAVGADIESVVNDNTPLMLSARLGNAAVARYLLEAGASVDHRTITAQRRTPLMVAVSGERDDIVTLLLSHGASVERADYSGRSALDYARQTDSRNGDSRFELMLAAAQGPPSAANMASGRTPEEQRLQNQILHSKLKFAVASCHVKRLITLLRENDDYAESDRIGDQPIPAHFIKPDCVAALDAYVRTKSSWHAAVYSTMEMTIDQCDTKSADTILGDNPTLDLAEIRGNQSLLARTVHAGCPDMLNLFLRKRDLVGELRSDVIVSAIKQVSQKTLLRTVGVLIRSGADVNGRNEQGITPLEAAIAYEQPVVAKYLIDAGADINAITHTGSYALIEASKKAYLHLVNELLDSGSNVNATDTLGRTALHAAVARGESRTVERLLRAGANRLQRDHNGMNAIVLAESYGHRSIHAALVER